jgi:hypothetical protein
MQGIDGKVVIITGASGGRGEETALLLASRGARVVLGARRLDRLEALSARIRDAGGQVAYRQLDVKKREDSKSIVDLAIERFGRLDVQVNNAGIMPISPLDDLKVDERFFTCRSSGQAKYVCLFGDQVCRPRHIGGAKAGGGRLPPRDGHFARRCRHVTRANRDKRENQDGPREYMEIAMPPLGDCSCDCLCDRATR